MKSPLFMLIAGTLLMFLSISFLQISIFSCRGRAPVLVQKEADLDSGIFKLRLYGPEAQEIADEVVQEIEELDSRMDLSSDQSAFRTLEQTSGSSSVRMEAELFDFVEKCVSFAELSNGAYDPTVEPLYELWQRNSSPSRERVAGALELVDFREVRLYPENRRVFLPKNGMVFSGRGLIDGYLLDQAKKSLGEYDLFAVSLEIDNVSYFEKMDHRATGKISGTLSLKNSDGETIVRIRETSNISAALIYPQDSLIINTLSGYPVDHELYAVLVLGHEAMTAKAIALIVAAKGLRDGWRLVEDLPFVEMLSVKLDGEVVVSSGMDQYIEHRSADYPFRSVIEHQY